MPDRSVVARPDSPVKVPAAHDAQFFVSIPIWIRVLVRGRRQKEVQLCEVPSRALSNTWFGDPMTGELCYSLTTRARRTADAEETPPNCAVVPVRIHNRSTDMLELERLCIRVEHLQIYPGESELWTSGIHVNYRGADQISGVDYESKAPTWEPVGPALCKPRQPVSRNMLKRTFSDFRAWTDF